MNHFGVSLLWLFNLDSFIFFQHISLTVISHVIVEVMFLLRLKQVLLSRPNNKKSHLPYIILSETFTYDMREWAKWASAHNHHVFSFLRNVHVYDYH